MKTNLISIAGLVLAILACGCQEQVSSTSNVRSSIGATGAPSEQTGSLVIAYYFHRTWRCRTCLAIETNAARVIESNFSQQMTDGQLIWMPFNLNDRGGKEFEKEFDISVSTLVLVKVQDGKHTKFRKLDNAWAYIGDPVKFDAYIQDEVRQFLDE